MFSNGLCMSISWYILVLKDTLAYTSQMYGLNLEIINCVASNHI